MAEARRLWHRAAAREKRAVEGSSLKRLSLMEGLYWAHWRCVARHFV